MAYVIFAIFGEEGEGRWLAWAYGRPQIKSNPATVWASVRNNPDVRVGLHTLQNLAQEFAPAALAGLRFSGVPVDPEIEGGEDDPPPAGSQTPQWSEIRSKWGFVYVQDMFVNMNTGDLVKRDALNELLRREALVVEAELFPPHGGKPFTMSAILSWRADTLRFRNMTYAPGDPQRAPIKDVPDETDFNLWRPTRHGRTPGVVESQVLPWLNHVDYMLGPRKDLFIEWCAWVAQNPILKPNWHFLIITIQGLGKDMMVAPLELAVGAKNFATPTIFQIADGFNDVLGHKLIVVSETRHLNTRSVSTHDTSTKLKTILAAPPPCQTINGKYQKRYEIPNRQALILFSNESNPLYLEEKQRRILVVNRLGIDPKDAAYYATLSNWLDHGGSELVASYLLQLRLSAGVDIKMKARVPETDDTMELEQLNRSPLHIAVDELIDEARGGTGNCASLVVTAMQVADNIAHGLEWKPSVKGVANYLRELERKGKKVSRANPLPNGEAGDVCGVLAGSKKHGRLWLLDDRATDGRSWSQITQTELIALWLNQPAPPSATVTPIRKRQLAEQPPSPPPNPPEDDDEVM